METVAEVQPRRRRWLVPTLGFMGVLTLFCVVVAIIASISDDAGQGKAAARCEVVAPALAQTLTDGLVIPGGSVRYLRAVRSPDHENVWFVGGVLQGVSLQGTEHIAAWSTNRLSGRGMILAINDEAVRFSEWPAARNTKADISMRDTGARAVVTCVKEA